MTNVLHTLTLSCFLPVLPAPWSQPSPAPLHTASGSEPAGSSTNSRRVLLLQTTERYGVTQLKCPVEAVFSTEMNQPL